MSILLVFILAAMAFLAPSRDHTELGSAIALAVEAAPPLFPDDDDRRRTAALVVAVSFRESTLDNSVVSRTHDYCAMGINRRPDLAVDVDACIRVGLAMLRESFRMCPASPIAWYASGPGACTNARAQRISRDRMALAAFLARTVKP